MRALAVEDDPRIAADLAAALRSAGFRVEATGDGEEAWFLGDTEDYDLVVLDLGLPGLDGLAVLKRARALVRRAGGHAAAVQAAGALSLDTNRMEVAVHGTAVAVTALEYRLLAYLMQYRDRPVPPVELLDHLYGDDFSREANALEAVVARLRRKLGPGVIGTRRGFGFLQEQP